MKIYIPCFSSDGSCKTIGADIPDNSVLAFIMKNNLGEGTYALPEGTEFLPFIDEFETDGALL